MSIHTQHRSQFTSLSAATGPTVVPTRRRLDRRFPSLGFTITSIAPWIEVVLATDPSLIDPRNAPARTDANFYASRVHGGLTPTTAGRARYVVPPAVVDRLCATASSLWYLAIAYDDATGMGGTPSTTSGASGAVTVDESYRRATSPSHRRHSTLSRILSEGSAGDRLDGEDGGDLPGPAVITASDDSPTGRRRSLAIDLPDDRREGEDGLDLPVPAHVTPQTSPPSRDAAPPVVPAEGADPASTSSAPEPETRSGAQSTTAQSLEEYDDGWGDILPGTVPALGSHASLDDEYPDIDWGSGDDADDSYGEVPAYRGLDDEPAAASGDVMPTGADQPTRNLSLPTLDLAPDQQRRIIELTAGGDGSGYSAVNADGPFRGRLGPGHKAYQRFHTGLSFGIAEFSQDSGSLGQLLRLMADREPDTFGAVFGADSRELLAVTTAPGPSGELVEGGRGPRVQPVAGFDLWEEPWLSRFRAAGAVPAFRAAQNQLAAELFLAPMLTVAAGFGLTTERALCMVLDRAIMLGDQGARRWIADTVGPARTPALRHSALAALGFESIEAFQAAVPGLLDDGEFGPITHATLTSALRALGPAAPLPLPTTQQAVEEMARRGEGEEGATRLLRLATSTEVSDQAPGRLP